MAENKGWFKPGNRMYDLAQIGRPEYWTDEKIKEILDKLDIWIEKEDSICMAGFRGENSLTPDVMRHIRLKSSVFSRAYTNPQQIVANRMAVKLGNGVHQAHYNKYQSVYDSELKEHEKEMMMAKATSEEDARKESIAEAVQVANLVKDQIDSYRSARKMDDKININE